MNKKFSLPGWVGIVIFFLVLLLPFIPHFYRLGVMTPWEMDRVATAIELAENPSKPWMAVQHIDSEGDVAPMPLWVAALGFKTLGISEAGGRLPSLLLLVIAFAVTFWSVRRLIAPRAATFGLLVFAVFPFTATQILEIGGYGVPMAMLAIAFACLALARWWKRGEGAVGAPTGEMPAGRILALLLGLGGLAGGYLSIGGIVGLLLPVTTMVFAQLFTGDWRLFVPGKAREMIREEGIASVALSILFMAALIVLLILIVPVAISKEPEFNLLAGGTPRIGVVPTIDYYLEHIAYGLYPWSTLLPAGMAALLLPSVLRGSSTDEKLTPGRVYMVIANFLGFAAINFFAFRYVNIPYIVLMPAAVACGVLLYDLEESQASWKTIGMIACLLLLLFLRDLHLYPDSVAELWTSQTLKEAYPVKMLHKVHLGIFTFVFMIALFYVFLQGSRKLSFLAWFAPELAIARAFRGEHGKAWKIAAWCIFAAWVIAVLNVVLIATRAPVPPFKLFTSIARKVSYGVALLPVIVLVCDFGFRLAYNALASMTTLRVDLLVAAGFVFGFWFNNGYLPTVAKNLSPTAAVDFFKQHAAEGDELLTYRVKESIGKFYGLKKVRQLTSQTSILKEFEAPKRVFMLYGREDNPSLNLAYKEKKHEHIYVPEAATWRFLLASNKPIPGVRQANPIESLVRMVPPNPEYHVYANLDNKIEYLGYDLWTKHEGDWAGALEKFVYTSYWHCTDRVPGSYQFFIHVDGFGLRLNGDHEPLEGLYPTRYWRPGDYLIDRYEMQVPIHFRAGEYTIFVGLFQGETRVKQVAGPTSGDDRIEGGILKVR
jgi:hypothetical protein